VTVFELRAGRPHWYRNFAVMKVLALSFQYRARRRNVDPSDNPAEAIELPAPETILSFRPGLPVPPPFFSSHSVVFSFCFLFVAFTLGPSLVPPALCFSGSSGCPSLSPGPPSVSFTYLPSFSLFSCPISRLWTLLSFFAPSGLRPHSVHFWLSTLFLDLSFQSAFLTSFSPFGLPFLLFPSLLGSCSVLDLFPSSLSLLFFLSFCCSVPLTLLLLFFCPLFFFFPVLSFAFCLVPIFLFLVFFSFFLLLLSRDGLVQQFNGIR